MISSADTVVVYWFRQDLRLHDSPALAAAIEHAKSVSGRLLPLYLQDPKQLLVTRWGFPRQGNHRQAWLAGTLKELSSRLQGLGSRLYYQQADPVQLISRLAAGFKSTVVFCEKIATPEEGDEVLELRRLGVDVRTVWQSSLLEPEDLPFALAELPDRFTSFRQAVETGAVRAPAPLPPPSRLPLFPPDVLLSHCPELLLSVIPAQFSLPTDPRSSFPCGKQEFSAGEQGALAHLDRYCHRQLPHHYKATRNGLLGPDFSSKWSPWLATGALSPRKAWAEIELFEQTYGANDGTYWLWFELLWRDHFRLLHLKYGKRLYQASGLSGLPPPSHDAAAFKRWCEGKTGQPFIDAGMRELAMTGYLSNRMRQNVASHLVHDLGCDFRAGAAWFESCLLDYDVYSNQGNWLYMSGRGTDPRANRRFSPELQSRQYDPDETYRRTWSAFLY